MQIEGGLLAVVARLSVPAGLLCSTYRPEWNISLISFPRQRCPSTPLLKGPRAENSRPDKSITVCPVSGSFWLDQAASFVQSMPTVFSLQKWFASLWQFFAYKDGAWPPAFSGGKTTPRACSGCLPPEPQPPRPSAWGPVAKRGGARPSPMTLSGDPAHWASRTLLGGRLVNASVSGSQGVILTSRYQ